MLTDPETLKMVTSSFDPRKGTVQAATGSIDGIPTFPYTKVPNMPPNLWWQGPSSKEGLHEHEGHDPVIVAKVPKLMRYQPPPTVQCPIGTRWLRSTWFLRGGTWEKVEDRVEPALQWERIDKYVERAVWQFHPIQPAAPARKVIQPRQHFGQDESFQLFIQEILDAVINPLPACILRCFKTMMRRMHAHHREQDNHRFFVPAARNGCDLLIPMHPCKHYISLCQSQWHGPWLAWLRICTRIGYWHSALDPNQPMVVMASSELHNWFTALAQRWHVQVVTITLQDDLLSQYGENLAKHAITKSNGVLFCRTLHGRIIMGEIEHNTRTNNKQTHPRQTA